MHFPCTFCKLHRYASQEASGGCRTYPISANAKVTVTEVNCLCGCDEQVLLLAIVYLAQQCTVS